LNCPAGHEDGRSGSRSATPWQVLPDRGNRMTELVGSPTARSATASIGASRPLLIDWCQRGSERPRHAGRLSLVPRQGTFASLGDPD
jgi:hypothetical protein